MVSIIVPVYQSKERIRVCLNSLINQTYQNIEIILVDDGSNDGSELICNQFSEEYSFIKTIHQVNQGVSAARNQGILNAKGKYILFVDSDDFIEYDTVEKMVCSMENTKSDLVIADFAKIIKNRRYIFSSDLKEGIYENNEIGDLFWSLFTKYIMHNIGTKLYKADIIKHNNILFDKRLSIYEDILFSIYYITKCNRVFYIKEVKYFYYIGSKVSLRLSYKNNFLDAHKRLFCYLKNFLEQKSKFNDYAEEYYRAYLNGIFEVIKNEYYGNVKKKDNIIHILDENDINKSKAYIKNLPIKQKIMYTSLWHKRYHVIIILIKINILLKIIKMTY